MAIFPYLQSANTPTPSAASTASVTPSSTAWANGAYTELIASASANLLLLSMAVTPSGAVTAGVSYEIDLATGGAGSETVFATIPAERNNSGGGGVANVEFPFPLQIASGARVAARVRTSGTNTSPFGVALSTVPANTYTGDLYSTAAAVKCVPTGSSLSCTAGASWANGSWVQLTSGLGVEIVIFGFAHLYGASGDEYEIDIGTGAAGSEVVLTTIRDNTGGSNGGDPNVGMLQAPITIAASTRIAVRARTSRGSTVGTQFKLAYYEKPLGADVPSTATATVGAAITPAAANGTTLTSSASAGAWGSWVELIASASADLALHGVVIHGTSTDGDIQVGVGAAGAESVIATLVPEAAASGRHRMWMPLPIPVTGAILSGNRVAARLRTTGTSQTRQCALVTSASFDGGITTTKTPKVQPDSITRTSIAVNTTAWASSSWVEFTSGLANPIGLYGIRFDPATAVQFELDIGTGAAGSETVLHTIRNYTSASGKETHVFGSVVLVAASTRIALRVRKSDTNGTAWTAALLYYDNLQASDSVPPSSGQPAWRRYWGIPYMGHGRSPRAAVWG